MPNLVILMAEKKVLEHRSGLRTFEKELPEWRSGAFRHKNAPGYWVFHRFDGSDY
jgi:hypothetical protein